MQKDPIREEIYTVTVRRDLRTGIVISESWVMNGKAHREDGPAQIRRDPATGIVTREAWIRNNQYDREDGPAVILRKAETGHIYYSAWFRNHIKIKAPRPPLRRKLAAAQSPSGP
jgi:hypothetical protein